MTFRVAGLLVVASLNWPVWADDPGTFDQALPNGNFSDGLSQWTVDVPDGLAVPAPTIGVVAGAARIERGGAYVAGLSQEFTAPDGLLALKFRLTEMPVLTADGSFIPDAFDVHVTDSSGRSRSASIRAGASAVANEAAVPFGFNLGPGATLDGDQLRIPVPGAVEGESLTVSVALVGASRDTASVVAIDDVVLEIQRKRPPPGPDRLDACGFFRDRYQSAARPPEIPSCWVRQIGDTGQQGCLGGSSGECPAPGRPGQDAEFGRDALAASGTLLKRGAGPAGFDYNKLDDGGRVLPDDAEAWSCVVDNVTGLIWEVKVDDPASPRHFAHTYSWRQTDSAINGGWAGEGDGGQCIGSLCDTSALLDVINLQGLCGASDWRIPTREELATLIHSGATLPAMAADYFPLAGGQVWTWTAAASNTSLAWRVDMETGAVELEGKGSALRVRLVREIR
jgi:hypothetical protein